MFAGIVRGPHRWDCKDWDCIGDTYKGRIKWTMGFIQVGS